MCLRSLWRWRALLCWGGMQMHLLILTAWSMLRNWWGGVGVVSLELDRMVDATQLMLWDANGSLELDRMVDATQLMWWGWGGISWTWPHGRCYATDGVGCKSISWTWPHGRCYATDWVGLGWGGMQMHILILTAWSMPRNGWGGVGVASLELDRMADATQLMGWDANASLELDRMVDATQLMGWGWGGISWTWPHGRCYATDGVGCKCISWTWPHGRCHATDGAGLGWHLLNLTAWSMLRNWWGGVGVGWDANGSLELDRMVDATQLMLWDANASLELDRMVDATQLTVCGNVSRSNCLAVSTHWSIKRSMDFFGNVWGNGNGEMPIVQSACSLLLAKPCTQQRSTEGGK